MYSGATKQFLGSDMAPPLADVRDGMETAVMPSLYMRFSVTGHCTQSGGVDSFHVQPIAFI